MDVLRLRVCAVAPLLAVLCGGAALRAAEAADSVAADDSKVTTLQEVVVTGERAWFEGDKAVFLPTKSEKNLATDPVSLVRNMHIPTIIIDQGQMKSLLSGQSVQVFINGRRAEGIDLQTFWPKQAIRVEYMENPSDPKFEGERAVVNFIMHEYEYGGITKLSAYQEFPDNGRYDVASKLEYGKMTYGLMLNGGYSRDHISSTEGEETYRDIFYNGEHYDLINRSYSADPWSRSDNAGVAFSARYNNPRKFRATHNVSFNWQRNPGSGSNDTELWTPELFDSNFSRSIHSGHSISPALSGSYNVWVNPDWTFTTYWNYRYSHHNNYSDYRYDGLDNIVNNSRDDVHSGSLKFIYGGYLNKKVGMRGTVATDMDWFRTHYYGNTEQFTRQYRGSTSAEYAISYVPSQKVSFFLSPGININYWHVDGGKKYSNVEPSGDFQFSWVPGRKAMFSVYAFYKSYSPTASNFSDVVLRQDELNWIAGNPALKNSSWGSLSANLVWMPRNNFRVIPSVNYSRNDNEFNYTFVAAPEDMGGLIRTYANGAASDDLNFQVTASLDLFDNALSLDLTPNWHYTSVSGPYAGNSDWLRFRGGCSYTFGNCQFGFRFHGKEKGMRNGGMEHYSTRNQYYLDFTYGQGDLYLNVSYEETFSNKPCTNITWIDTPNYSSKVCSYGVPRSVSVRLTYTFGYGKKVNRSIDVEGPSEGKSGVLK